MMSTLQLGWLVAVAGALSIPVITLLIGLVALVLKHRRQRSIIDLAQAYGARGRDVPPEILKILAASTQRDGKRIIWVPFADGGGVNARWNGAIFFGVSAAAITVASRYFHVDQSVLAVAAISGFIALALLLSAVVSAVSRRAQDDGRR